MQILNDERSFITFLQPKRTSVSFLYPFYSWIFHSIVRKAQSNQKVLKKVFVLVCFIQEVASDLIIIWIRKNKYIYNLKFKKGREEHCEQQECKNLIKEIQIKREEKQESLHLMCYLVLITTHI